ncbi:MAG: 3-phosphoglycerate dehydrogenase [Prevotellaceae bacterium]|jgi:D-3-phosphoglycerate dehydrogenase|nr:3-phosphoglycerate dehydrogenase [Prevotellaceae bacterium]
MKILIATEKPFAKTAVDGIRKIVENAGYELCLLEKYTDTSQLLSAVADANALIVRSDKVTKQVIDAAKNLKIVVRAGAGFDNLDLNACTENNIVAMNTPGQNSNAVAELVLGLMIFMNRNKFNAGTGAELKGKKLGIHAYGNVGRLVARIAKGFDMQILAFDPFVKKETIQADGVTVVDNVEELYANCNYVSLHIPANDITKKSINRKLLNLMPKGGCLINTARKEVIDEDDLIKLLEERTDMKYATDVAPSNISELQQKFDMRVFATPKKIGAETAEANINAGLAAANQIVNFFKNGDKTFQINK